MAIRKHNTPEPKETLSEKLVRLDKQMRNRSTKPLQRLRASMAFFEKKNLLASLPGSAKRGLSRGHRV